MARMSRLLQWAFVIGASIVAAEPAQPPRFDVLIRNGRVMDGTGNPWIRADVAITGDRIAAIGNLGNATASRTIDAQDRVVAPGFIDAHSHAAEGIRNAA